MMKSLNPVTLPESSYHDLVSTTNEQTYRVYIGGVRAGHVESSPRPLIFVMDGNWLFASTYEYIRTLSLFDPSIGGPVVVGIGYPTEDVNTLLQKRREDMSPRQGNMANVDHFLSFIWQDVMAFLESEFGITSNNKILAGHSLGGAFALYTLTLGEAGFDGYLASSPPVLDTVMEKIEKHIQNIALTKQTKLFTSLGADEASQFPDISQGFPVLTKALEQHAPDNLRYKQVIFEEETHASVTFAAFSRGLRYLLS